MPPPPFRRLNLPPGGMSARAPNPDAPGETFRSKREIEEARRDRALDTALRRSVPLSKKGSRGRVSGIGRRSSWAGPLEAPTFRPPRTSPMNRRPPGRFPSVRLPNRERFAPAQQARRSVLGGIGSRFRKLFGL